MNALAKEFGLHRTTVAQHLAGAGVTRTKKVISPEQVERAAELYRQGSSLAVIGRQLGFDPATIHTHLRRAGVVMRSPHG